MIQNEPIAIAEKIDIRKYRKNLLLTFFDAMRTAPIDNNKMARSIIIKSHLSHFIFCLGSHFRARRKIETLSIFSLGKHFRSSQPIF